VSSFVILEDELPKKQQDGREGGEKREQKKEDIEAYEQLARSSKAFAGTSPSDISLILL